MKAAAGNGKSMQQQFKNEKPESSVEAWSNNAVIREKIQLTNDNKHVETFKHAYDRVFREFQEKLLIEYR